LETGAYNKQDITTKQVQVYELLKQDITAKQAITVRVAQEMQITRLAF
jgi:hypothetical protein